ncbi:MAG: hypothetical protein JO206_11340, partial [Solirubrobacterales bacterium]|nr:hypothetical protein [Solirubrobacterales bacterium]MBV9473554.1 hypothetical protein [Solirubrobacterales bacterium]
MPDVLLFGDTVRTASLRHEVPVTIGDPFLYAEVGETAHIMTSSLERKRVGEVRPDAVLLDIGELGFHDLLRSGISRDQVFLE